MKDIAIVFDCGATNVRVIAMDTTGKILASKTTPNETDEDPNYKGGRIWDIDKMWQKLVVASQHVTSNIDTSRIAGVSVTTFGVDGTFLDKDGKELYPVISWQCERTQAIIDNIGKYMPLLEVYKTSGIFPYAFNTINKMIWFHENRPDIPEKAHRFLFIPSLFIYKMTGAMQNETTMAGTSMMFELGERDFSTEILSKIGIERSLFGKLAKPGDKAGELHAAAEKETGIPAGTPVFFAGHDTQFAIFGSGATLNQAVLSSGTWEILMARTENFKTTEKELAANLTFESDPIPGVYNIGQNWIGSGILEWFTKNFCSGLSGNELYETIIGEAELVNPGEHGLSVNPDFYKESGHSTGGSISGLTINTSRGEIYRAILEGLAFRLKEGLEALEEAGNFKAEKILCVGGGSKNRLWNQLRTDVCGIPIQLIDQKETTVLGASLFVFSGAGLYTSPEEARNHIPYNPTVISPSEQTELYKKLYQRFSESR